MDVIFFLIRLPFFVIGIALLLAIGIVVSVLVLGFVPCVLPLALAVWLLLLLLAVINAAFTNRTDALTSFFKETQKWISDLTDEYVIRSVGDYLKLYGELFRWLIRPREET